MKCPGCSYSGNDSDGYSGMPSASYLANLGGLGVQASYSHVSSDNALSYSASDNLPAINYNPDTSNSSNQIGYSGLPSQLDYQISKALMEIESKKQEIEPVSASNEITVLPSPAAKYEIVPIQQGFTEVAPEHQAMMQQMQEMPNQNLPFAQQIPKNGAVRLTQTDIEEDLLIMRRTRIRQRSMTFLNENEAKREPKRIN